MLRVNLFKFFHGVRSPSFQEKRNFSSYLSPLSILKPTNPMLEEEVKRLLQLRRNENPIIDNIVNESLPRRTSCFDPTLLARYDFLHSWPFTDIVGINSLTRLCSNVFLKQPHHITGTIKDRVVLYVLLDMIRRQELSNNNNIITVSSGSYAVSLMMVKYILEKFTGIRLNATIVIPDVHREKKWVADLISFATFSGNAMKIKEVGTDVSKLDLQGHDTLLFIDSTFGLALIYAKKLAADPDRRLKFIDQQADIRHVYAHAATANEILLQYPSVTDIVVPVGTGATSMGLREILPPRIKIHCHPAKTGTIGGLGDPSINPGFFKKSFFTNYDKKLLTPEDSKPSSSRFGEMIYFPILSNYDSDDYNGMEYFRRHVGESTLAVLGTADEIASSPNSQVLVIGSSDTGFSRELLCRIFHLKGYDPHTGIMTVRSHLDEQMGLQSLIEAHYHYDIEDPYHRWIRDYYNCPKQNEPFKESMTNRRIIAPMLKFIQRTEGPMLRVSDAVEQPSRLRY